MATLGQEIKTLKAEITKLKKCNSNADYRHKREVKRLQDANVNLNKTINKLTENGEHYEATLKDLVASEAKVEELVAKNNGLTVEKSNIKRSIEEMTKCRDNAVHDVGQHLGALSTMQNEMKVVCEAVYGQDFDPEWHGDEPTPPPFLQQPTEYIEPIQRLLRMLWRRMHWAQHPTSSWNDSPEKRYGKA